jgi:hypothetical protein
MKMILLVLWMHGILELQKKNSFIIYRIFPNKRTSAFIFRLPLEGVRSLRKVRSLGWVHYFSITFFGKNC